MLEQECVCLSGVIESGRAECAARGGWEAAALMMRWASSARQRTGGNRTRSNPLNGNMLARYKACGRSQTRVAATSLARSLLMRVGGCCLSKASEPILALASSPHTCSLRPLLPALASPCSRARRSHAQHMRGFAAGGTYHSRSHSRH